MPVDLYQWEAGGGLVHHCPKCFKPLTTPQARSRCLGEHVEWCRRYHTQLFKKGTSSQCLPCRHSDDQHQRRHRDIAELVHKLAMLNPIPTTTVGLTTQTPLSPDAISSPGTGKDATQKTKKERKAARKAKKVAEFPKALNCATIEHVGKVLHPNEDDAEDGELELQLLNDAEINDNRYFHKGTSNQREVRSELVKKDRKGDKVVFCVEVEEMEGLLQLLNVSPITVNSLPEEKRIVEELKRKIEKDLVQAQEEQEGLMMRKAGFWRWASKKAYNRLVANGRIWEDKSEGVFAAKSDESGGSTEGHSAFLAHSGDGSDETDITEPDVDGVTEVAESVVAFNMSTPKTPKTVTAAAGNDYEWTYVSNTKGKGPAKANKGTPEMTLKLSSNNGLAKMVQSSTPRKTGFLRYHSEDD